MNEQFNPFTDTPDWMRELFAQRCDLHGTKQPCFACSMMPKLPTPAPTPAGIPIDDENGDQHGVE